MVRALLLILDADGSWKKIAKNKRGFLFIFLLHLLPLLVVTLGAEAFAMTKLGEGRAITGHLRIVSSASAWEYFIAAVVLNLGMVLAAAKILQRIALSFRDNTTYLECFTVVAYALSPLYVAHLADAIPALNTWACFAIGMALSVSSVFHGTPAIMKPDAAKGFGVCLMGAVLLLLMAGLVHFMDIQVLHGELNFRFWEQFLTPSAPVP